MNPALKPWKWMMLWPLMAGIAAAQQPPSSVPDAPKQQARATAQSEAGEPRATAQSEAGEPRADTSRAAPAVPDASPPAAQPAERPAQPPASRAQTAVPARTAAPGQKSTATDRIDLGLATVTGDREQPKVMYIVPWKKSDIGDLSGKPMNSLLDEALAPIDRDEFKREVVYYTAVKADASQNGASRPPAKQGEK
jgi:hypothetical protein